MARIRSITTVVLLLIATQLSAAAQSAWEVKNTLHIGGEGGWDYVTVDSAAHRLFITRTTHTQVIDGESGRVLGDIPGQKLAHGVALVPSLNRGFITDGGGTGAIVVFDLTTYAVLGRIPTVPDSDGIIYDAKMNLILAVSGDGAVLITFKPDIDPVNGKVGPTIALGGAPEFLASDGTGKIFVNLADKDVVAVVDLHSRSVIARWQVAPGGKPVGMAIDTASHRLFVGCRNPQKLIVMSSETGKVLASLPIGAGVDATAFHQGQAFASCRDGSLFAIGQRSGEFETEETIKTPDGARTMGIDTASQRIYLPTAEFEPAPPGTRPKAKPGTFMIAVVGKS